MLFTQGGRENRINCMAFPITQDALPLMLLAAAIARFVTANRTGAGLIYNASHFIFIDIY